MSRRNLGGAAKIYIVKKGGHLIFSNRYTNRGNAYLFGIGGGFDLIPAIPPALPLQKMNVSLALNEHTTL